MPSPAKHAKTISTSPEKGGIRSGLERLGERFSKLNIYTKIFVILFLVSTLVLSIMWCVSGKIYLYLGTFHIGNLNVGPHEGKTFYSSLITFGATFVIAFFLLVEKQRRHPLTAFIVSYLVLQSASFTFEYVYILLFWQTQLILQYYPMVNWWLGLLAGYAVGFGFGFMRLNKISVILFSLFAITMAVWYFGGYPQLIHKETLAFTSQNYINLPVWMAYPLNVISKFFVCMAAASLLIKSPKKSISEEK